MNRLVHYEAWKTILKLFIVDEFDPTRPNSVEEQLPCSWQGQFDVMVAKHYGQRTIAFGDEMLQCVPTWAVLSRIWPNFACAASGSLVNA